MGDAPNGGVQRFIGETEATIGGICERVEKLEDRFERVTDKLFDRLRALEVRMAFYAGAAAVAAVILDRLFGR